MRKPSRFGERNSQPLKICSWLVLTFKAWAVSTLPIAQMDKLKIAMPSTLTIPIGCISFFRKNKTPFTTPTWRRKKAKPPSITQRLTIFRFVSEVFCFCGKYSSITPRKYPRITIPKYGSPLVKVSASASMPIKT